MDELAVPTVRFEVRLVDHVEPEFVAQVKQHGVRRIVRHPNGIDVVPLHRQNIKPMGFGRHHTAGELIVIVAIDSTKQDRATVQQ